MSTSPKSRKARRRLDVVMGILVFVGLSFLVVVLGRLVWLGWDSEHWPKRTAIIEKSGYRDSPGKGEPSYYASITYRYDVDGKTYRSNRYHFDWNWKLYGQYAPQTFERDYAVGKVLEAAVHPDIPDRATIRTGVPPWTWYGLGLFSVVLAAGLYAVHFEWRSNWRGKSTPR